MTEDLKFLMQSKAGSYKVWLEGEYWDEFLIRGI